MSQLYIHACGENPLIALQDRAQQTQTPTHSVPNAKMSPTHSVVGDKTRLNIEFEMSDMLAISLLDTHFLASYNVLNKSSLVLQHHVTNKPYL